MFLPRILLQRVFRSYQRQRISEDSKTKVKILEHLVCGLYYIYSQRPPGLKYSHWESSQCLRRRPSGSQRRGGVDSEAPRGLVTTQVATLHHHGVGFIMCRMRPGFCITYKFPGDAMLLVQEPRPQGHSFQLEWTRRATWKNYLSWRFRLRFRSGYWGQWGKLLGRILVFPQQIWISFA